VNQSDGTVSVLLGNGDGTFRTAVTYNVGTTPTGVVVGDFAGNGKLDIAVTNQGSDTVSVLMGNGDGTFQTAVNYAAGSGPSALAVGDFNHDGKLDLAVTDLNSGRVSILLGNGDGTFQPAVWYAGGLTPDAIAVGDFSGDGKLDLAVASQGGGVNVLLGIGDGTFQTASNYIAGSRSVSVAVGDFSLDGKPDLVVANQSSNTITVLPNQAATATNVTAALSAPVYGQLETFTAVIGATTPGAGIPTGTVQFVIDGVNAGNPVSVTTTGGITSATYTTTALAAGTHSIQAIYSGDPTFSGSVDNISDVVTPAPLTISAVSDSKQYDGTTSSAQTPTVGTLFNGDTVTGLAQAFSSKNVLGTGGSTLTVTSYTINDGNGGHNYTVTLASAGGTITPAPLTITAGADSKTYDGTTKSSQAPTVGTLYSTDTVTGLSQAFASKNVLGTGGSTLLVTGYTVNDGNGGADYTVSLATATGTITPAPLTISAASATKQYDGTTSSSQLPTVGTLYSTDTVTGLSQAFASKDVLGTSGSTLVVTGYTINDGDGGADYTVTPQTASGTITPAPLTISATGDSKQYDGTTSSAQNPTSSGTLYGSDTVSGLVQAFQSKDVLGTGGSTLVVTGYTVNDGNGGKDYSATLATASGTITPAPLTISAVAATKQYDGTTTSSQVPTVGTLYANDQVTGLTEAFLSKDVLGSNTSTLAVATYTINDGNGGKDYTVTLNTASGTITPAPLAITAASASKPYDGTTSSSQTPTVGTLYNSDTVTGLSQAYASKDVLGTGGSTLTVTGYTVSDGNGGKDYTVSLQSSSGTITPAPLTIAAGSDSKQYDSTTASSQTPTIIGTLYGSDTVTGLSQAFASKNVLGSNGSSLVVTGYSVNDGNSGKDYAVTFQSASGTITPAALTITAVSDSKPYDGTTSSSQAPTVSGKLYGSDTVTGLSQAFASKDVLGANGSGLVVAGYTVNDGNSGKDYTVTLQAAAGTITPVALTISATSDTKTYDGTTGSSKTPSVNGLLGHDTVTGLSQTFSSPHVLGTGGSTLTVTAYTVNDGNGGKDYTVTLQSTAGTITPAPLTITADGQSMVYGGTLPTLTASFTGLVGGDTPNTFNTSPNTPPVLSTVPATSHQGSYAINVSAAADADYAITFAAGTLTITPAPLTITAVNESMTYGGAAPTLAATYAGLVNGDTPATFSKSPNKEPSLSTVPATSHAGDYSITASGAVDSDYTITYVSGTLTINPASLTITANNQSMVYGGTLPGLTASYAGLVNGDTPAVFASAPNTPPLLVTVSPTSKVGSYGITVSGAADPDYAITFTSGTLTITPAPLTISADNKSTVFGAPLPGFTASYQGFVNGDSAASLTTPVTLSTTATTSSNAGDYPITPAGATDSNYTIAFTPGTLTIGQAGTSTSVSSSLSNPVNAQSVTFTATITVTAPSSATPAGMVQFQVNGANFGNPVSVSTTGGTTSAALTTTTLPLGHLTITVIYSGSGNFVTSQAQTAVVSGTDNQRWVNQVYLDLLNRPVDPTGLGVWTGALSQGATRTQIAQAIEASGEYFTDVVQGYYEKYLHRAADAGGLQSWVGLLEAGATKEQVQAGITGSGEYFQNRGGGTINGFLNALYQDGLGRAIDPSGQSIFSAALAGGATPGQVASAIFGSGEYLQDVIQADYEQFLHRPADNFGLTSFLNALKAGATDQAVAAVFLGSGEYFANV
jgi:hypothetical protein